MSTRHEFDAEVVGRGPNGAWPHIVMPFDVPAAFGARSIIPVKGTANGFAFRSSIAPRSGEFYLMFNKDMRQGAGVEIGDTVDMVIDIDREPRTVEITDEMSHALDAAPIARSAFDRLSYSHKKEYVTWLEDAKRPETRQKRLKELIMRLSR